MADSTHGDAYLHMNMNVKVCMRVGVSVYVPACIWHACVKVIIFQRGRTCMCIWHGCVHMAQLLTRARGGRSTQLTAFRLSSSRHSSLTLHGPCWPRLLLHPHHRAAAAHSCARGGRPKATPLPGDAEDVPKARAALPGFDRPCGEQERAGFDRPGSDRQWTRGKQENQAPRSCSDRPAVSRMAGNLRTRAGFM